MSNNCRNSLSKSREDYLEAIYEICQDKKVARVKSIASRLDVTRSSVNYAIKVLSDAELLEHEPYGYVVLTDRGEEVAKEIKKKHRILKNFLVDVLGVQEDIAEVDACEMEHTISEDTTTRIEEFLKSKKEKNNGSDRG